MRGQVLEAQPGGGGTIAATDGSRYTFKGSDWRGPSAPVVGGEVDFIAGEGIAADIFPLPARDPSGSTASTASTSSSSAGAPPRGPHYAPVNPGPQPNEGSSVLLGALGILCLLVGFVIPVIPTIAAFVLGLVGADSAKRHNNSTGLVLSRVSWIGALVLMIVGVVLISMLALFAGPMIAVFLDSMWTIVREEAAKDALLSFL